MLKFLKDLAKGAIKTVVTRIAGNVGNMASKNLEQKSAPSAPRQTKSKELSTLEQRYLVERDKREQIALEIQREQLRLQAQIHAQQIELSLKQIQADFDEKRWVGILSRDETLDILHTSQEKHHLLMLLSEPEVSPNCPESFKHDLPIAVRNELKQFMQEHYSFHNEFNPVQFFGKFFERDVFDAHIKQYERLLSQVPTVVLYSQMTDENLYLHLYGWGFGKIPLTETCTLNWEEIYKQLQSAGNDDRNIHKAIRKIIVGLHQAFAAYCSDFYYLTMINPLHQPQLLTIDFSEELQIIIEPLKVSLQSIYQQNKDWYESDLQKQQQDSNTEEYYPLAVIEKKSSEIHRWRKYNKEPFKTYRVSDGKEGIALQIDKADAIDKELLWCRFALGQTWAESSINYLCDSGNTKTYENWSGTGEPTLMTWLEAQKAIKTFNANGGWAGYTDWRLPTLEELAGLLELQDIHDSYYRYIRYYEHKKYDFYTFNHIYEEVFPNNKYEEYQSIYWTATTHDIDSNGAYCVDFFGQGVEDVNKRVFKCYAHKNAEKYAVRLVRSVPNTAAAFRQQLEIRKQLNQPDDVIHLAIED